MTQEQLKSLINYIDATINERLDNGRLDGQGVESTVDKIKALEELRKVFTN